MSATGSQPGASKGDFMRGTHRPGWFGVIGFAGCVVLASLHSACSSSNDPWPTPTSPTPPAASEFVALRNVPVAGRPAEETGVRILGKGFQSGATVMFDGSLAPATLEGTSLVTTAPRHPAGAIDIVVTNPDGRTSRLEKAFLYVEDLQPNGDIAVSPGNSVTATLGRDDGVVGGCTDDGMPCRRLFIRAPADDTIELEVVPLGRQENVGLFDERQAHAYSPPTLFPKQLTVKGGQQVWVMGEWAVFRVTASVAK